MKKKRSRSKRVSFVVSPYVWAHVRTFHATGLYGRTMADVAREMFLRTLRREIGEVSK